MTTRRGPGYEPPSSGLTPIASRPSTKEEKEISIFFRERRAANDKNPGIVALRAKPARQQGK